MLRVVIGPLPDNREGDQFRQIVQETIGEHPYVSLTFCDNATPERVPVLIDGAMLGFFDAVRRRAGGGLLELGYAIGRGLYCVVLQGRRPASIDGFRGDQTVSYRSPADLRRILGERSVEWLGAAIDKRTAAGKLVSNIDSRLLRPVARGLLEADLIDEFHVAGQHGLSEEQVEGTLAILERLAMVRQTGAGWTLTRLGEEHLPRLLAGMEGPGSQPAADRSS